MRNSLMEVGGKYARFSLANDCVPTMSVYSSNHLINDSVMMSVGGAERLKRFQSVWFAERRCSLYVQCCVTGPSGLSFSSLCQVVGSLVSRSPRWEASSEQISPWWLSCGWRAVFALI
ncbi:hypothetical protein RRG08_039491 [Elysia crispata]|uniref:Uncharacterized protein n=1 Tax=Elysia crispata TaxID=231223 RepID=A0AAE0YJN8_9GAST|nr:hypothetical protein RRG08_039491 [Elysia crispata]